VARSREELALGFEKTCFRRCARFGVRLANETRQLEDWQECARQAEQVPAATTAHALGASLSIHSQTVIGWPVDWSVP